MNMVSLSGLNKPNLLYISSTQSARAFKGNPFLYFPFEDFKIFQLQVPMALNPKFLDLEKIAIQCRGKQSLSKVLFLRRLYKLILVTNISLRTSGDKPL